MSTIEAEGDYTLLMRATADVKEREDVRIFAAAVGAKTMWDAMTGRPSGGGAPEQTGDPDPAKVLIVSACSGVYNFFAVKTEITDVVLPDEIIRGWFPRICDEIEQVLLAGVLYVGS